MADPFPMPQLPSFDQWFGSTADAGYRSPVASKEAAEDARGMGMVEYGQLTTPDASGYLPYGTDIMGVRPGVTNQSFDVDGQTWFRGGVGPAGITQPELRAMLQGLGPDQFRYDPQRGPLFRQDFAGGLNDKAREINERTRDDEGWMNNPLALMGLMAAMAFGGNALAGMGGGGTGATAAAAGGEVAGGAGSFGDLAGWLGEAKTGMVAPEFAGPFGFENAGVAAGAGGAAGLAGGEFGSSGLTEGATLASEAGFVPGSFELGQVPFGESLMNMLSGAGDILSSPMSNLFSGARSLFSGGGGPGNGSPMGNALSIGSGIYGLMQSERQRRLARQMMDRSDPFGQYRPEFGAMLSNLYSNPSKIFEMPGYKAGEQAVMRNMASQGYLGSGNMMHAMMKYGGDFFNQEATRLGTFAGAGFNPASGAQMLMGGESGANDLASRSLASIGYGLGGGRSNAAELLALLRGRI